MATGRTTAALNEDLAMSLQWSEDGKTVTSITPDIVGWEEPQGRPDTYPAIHVWDWRENKRIRSLDAEIRN